jgi:acyl-CoA synthetase (AMP-forming)/AMP-acid ligase II
MHDSHTLIDNLIHRVNVGDLLTRSAARAPRQIALVDGERRLTYRQFNEAANRLAHGFASLGYARGDAVALMSGNSAEFLITYFACAKLGLICVPINLFWRHGELAYVLSHAEVRCIVVEAVLLGQLETGTEGMAKVDALIVVGRADAVPDFGVERVLDYETLTTAMPAADVEAIVGDRDPLSYLYTSGTTSAPKGVLLRHRHLVSYVLGTVEFAAAGEDDVALICVPPYHIAAVANVISNLFAGRRTVILDHFDARDWLATVRAENVTNALVVPTMLARIVEYDGDQSVPSLRALAYGGAPMPARVIEKALALWPEVGFVNAYGLTETSSTIAVLGPQEHREAAASTDPTIRARLTSAGRVIPAIELRILDGEGNEVPPGTAGRICVRGEQVSAEYDRTGVAVDEQGFFDTRDEGYLDEDGFLFIGGRADDTIIRGGENIAPAEIESVLLEDPAVLDVAVIGVPDDEWGQRIEAAVVPAPGHTVDPDALRDLVRARLRGSKTPDRVHVVERLPRTETGKLVRRQVSALIA